MKSLLEPILCDTITDLTDCNIVRLQLTLLFVVPVLQMHFSPNQQEDYKLKEQLFSKTYFVSLL